MKKTLLVTSVLVLVLATVGSASAARLWVHLGDRSVTDRVDHDVIVVTGDRGTFTALRLAVRKRAVQFHRVRVVFGNGEVQELELRQVIPAGGESRVIDLAGGSRVIRRVELWYDAQSLGGRAVVRLAGRR